MGTGAGQDYGGICTAARIDLKEHCIDRQCRPQPGATLPVPCSPACCTRQVVSSPWSTAALFKQGYDDLQERNTILHPNRWQPTQLLKALNPLAEHILGIHALMETRLAELDCADQHGRRRFFFTIS